MIREGKPLGEEILVCNSGVQAKSYNLESGLSSKEMPYAIEVKAYFALIVITFTHRHKDPSCEYL